MTRIAVLGLTDAGLQFAVALQASGAEVIGFDPAAQRFAPIELATSVEEAVRGAEVVLSFSTPQNAFAFASQSAPLLKADALYVELGPGTPAHKQGLSDVFPAGSFLDGTLNGSALEISGPRAQQLGEDLENIGVSSVVVSAAIGDVAKRALVRTLLRNGLAEVLTDTLWTAESLGIEDWAWEDIQKTLTEMNSDSAQALIDDAAYNFKSHQMSMQDVVEVLSESGYESTMIAPIQFTHGRLMHGKKIPHSQAPAKKWMR